MEQLALLGGPKVKTTPFGTGKRFGDAELMHLKEALDQNTLFYMSGNKVKQFLAKFTQMYGMQYGVAASSGTASLHVALGAVGVTEGDEVITSPITDMGSIIGILYQNAIPIFADLLPHTYNLDPKSVKSCITEKTKAIMVVHLAGNPCDMDAINAIAKAHNIAVIEDCAQSYQCYYKGALAGTLGDIGCFSLNDFKHISTGDGGMLIMNDEELYHTAFRFADKNYNRFGSTPQELRNIPYIAPNYRMSELQGAVALAQLDRIEGICQRRNDIGEAITHGIEHIDGIHPPLINEGDKSSYWFYMLRIDKDALGVDAVDFSAALKAEGIPCQQGYIPHCVYEYDLFKNKSAYINTHAPFDSKYYGKPIEYKKGLCPVAEEILLTAVRIEINEFYTDEDVQQIIAAVNKVASYYLNQA